MEKISAFLKSKAGIAIICAVALALVVIAVESSYIYRLKATVAKTASVADAFTDADENAPKENDAGDADTASEENSYEEVSEEPDEFGPQLFVCVPYDEMNLRSAPGSTGEDDKKLYAGDKVLWDGKSETVGGIEYYFVKTASDGKEGYALADLLVPVYYDHDESLLSIVETDDALYTYEMMEKDLERLSEKYSDLLTKEIYGKSADGRDLYCLYLGNRDSKHKIFTQASIHGREYMNTQLVMRLVEYYCANSKTGKINGRSYEDLFDNVCICVVPMANPDGVTIAQSGTDEINDSALIVIPVYCYQKDAPLMTAAVDELGDSFWVDHYKDEGFDRSLIDEEMITSDEYMRQWKSNANGVDLNDNFDANWEEVDLKDDISYGSYKGESPESEPESSALVSLATENEYDMYISYHSKGELIYYDTPGNKPAISQSSQELAELARSQIKYRPLSNKTAYNVTQGGFSDWVQLKLEKPAITIESGRHRCPLSIKEFEPMWLRHRELWAVLMYDLAGDEI